MDATALSEYCPVGVACDELLPQVVNPIVVNAPSNSRRPRCAERRCFFAVLLQSGIKKTHPAGKISPMAAVENDVSDPAGEHRCLKCAVAVSAG
jgi:hypothetical protein